VAKLKKEPLRSNHSLDKYDFVEATPCVGREYSNLSIRDMLNAPNSDELIQEFAYTVSNRGVVFLRNQEMTLTEQKTFVQKMGELSGKPKESGLHIHPAINARVTTVVHEEAQADKHAFLVSNRLWDTYFAKPKLTPEQAKQAKKNSDMSRQWHNDLAWEAVPADYSFLRMIKHPPTGADTLYASSVEVYNRMSKPMQEYLKTLTFNSGSSQYKEAQDQGLYKVYTDPRGHPLNSGMNFHNTHPLIRTNPVTGLNALYGAGLHAKEINGVTKFENDHLLQTFFDMIARNHDLQCRFKWTQSPNSCAIWDNRSVYHAATLDLDNKYERLGIRVTSVGEVAYLDPAADNEALYEQRAAEASNGHTENGSTNGVNGHV